MDMPRPQSIVPILCCARGAAPSPKSGIFPVSGHTGPVAALVTALALLHGVVMRGPTAPVCRVSAPCNAPAVGAVLAFVRDGRVAARARAGKGGRYSVRLPVGVYSVRQLPSPKIGFRLRPAVVRVRAGSTRADFFIDTGIR